VPDLGRRLGPADLARDGLTLADKQRINRALLDSGAPLAR
jgi:glycerate-2-kinase